NDPPTN
ncbi:hypothetical protein MIMGU_mgv1a0042352mg, partial [Erythranthe guttata]